jgi:hypothetical protein
MRTAQRLALSVAAFMAVTAPALAGPTHVPDLNPFVPPSENPIVSVRNVATRYNHVPRVPAAPPWSEWCEPSWKRCRLPPYPPDYLYYRYVGPPYAISESPLSRDWAYCPEDELRN